MEGRRNHQPTQHGPGRGREAQVSSQPAAGARKFSVVPRPHASCPGARRLSSAVWDRAAGRWPRLTVLQECGLSGSPRGRGPCASAHQGCWASCVSPGWRPSPLPRAPLGSRALGSQREGAEGGGPRVPSGREAQCWCSGSDFPRNSLDQGRTAISQTASPEICLPWSSAGLSEEAQEAPAGPHSCSETLRSRRGTRPCLPNANSQAERQGRRDCSSSLGAALRSEPPATHPLLPSQGKLNPEQARAHSSQSPPSTRVCVTSPAPGTCEVARGGLRCEAESQPDGTPRGWIPAPEALPPRIAPHTSWKASQPGGVGCLPLTGQEGGQSDGIGPALHWGRPGPARALHLATSYPSCSDHDAGPGRTRGCSRISVWD